MSIEEESITLWKQFFEDLKKLTSTLTQENFPDRCLLRRMLKVIEIRTNDMSRDIKDYLKLNSRLFTSIGNFAKNFDCSELARAFTELYLSHLTKLKPAIDDRLAMLAWTDLSEAAYLGLENSDSNIIKQSNCVTILDRVYRVYPAEFLKHFRVVLEKIISDSKKNSDNSSLAYFNKFEITDDAEIKLPKRRKDPNSDYENALENTIPRRRCLKRVKAAEKSNNTPRIMKMIRSNSLPNLSRIKPLSQIPFAFFKLPAYNHDLTSLPNPAVLALKKRL